MPVLLALHIDVAAIEDVVWRQMGSCTTSFIENMEAILAKASTCTFSAQGILLTSYSVNFYKLAHTFERY